MIFILCIIAGGLLATGHWIIGLLLLSLCLLID